MIELNIAPIAKPRMTRSDKWKQRRCVQRYFAFCDIVKWQLKKNKVNLKQFEFDGYNITFVLPMPKSMSKKNKQEFLNTPHQKRPDIDNLIKSFFDAIYEEDSHIWKVSAIKIWGKEGKIILS